ncbi:uncharacterized protein LOC115661867 [Syzygium oleosum]|uniref:uncharacterized protein LOC115661867 n=1 Tax=Syzygium oleosum TaxID=219896 RepID=UPI0011D2C5F1|nr:uncharacterized protein LOC115661867 [Syzygium oleosum]
MEDPRVDGILRALAEVRTLMGRQTQGQAAAVAAAVEAAVAAANGANGNNGNSGHNESGNGNYGDPEVVSLWVEELKKAFEVLGCTKEKKVTLAVYQLQGNASDWWKATRGRVFPAGTAQTLVVFVEVFNGKCFSESAREQKMAEFL